MRRGKTRTLGGMAKLLALLIAVIAALIGVAGYAQPQGDWAVHWMKGLEAKEQRDYDTAVREISRSIELTGSPESKDMFVNRGDAYFGQGKYEQAIADYAHAIQLSKRNAGEIMGGDYASRTRTFDLAPIYEKLGAAYSALAVKSRELK